MKKQKRFMITEIYQDDMHAVDKVLVDTQTHVQYLLHLEGAGCCCTPLIDENGKPLMCHDCTPHPDSIRKENIFKEHDKINFREKDEPIEVIQPIEIKKSRKKDVKSN